MNEKPSAFSFYKIANYFIQNFTSNNQTWYISIYYIILYLIILDALNLFSKHPVKPDVAHRTFNTNTIAWKLLNAVADMKDPTTLKKLFNALVDNNFVQPVNVILGPLIKVHLLR